MTREELIAEAGRVYGMTGSIRAVCREIGVSHYIATKLVVTAGYIPEGRAARVHQLIEGGLSVAEIAAQIGINESHVNAYLPYAKGCYINTDKTENALRIIKCRRNG